MTFFPERKQGIFLYQHASKCFIYLFRHKKLCWRSLKRECVSARRRGLVVNPDLHQVVEETSVQGLGESVARVARLLLIQRHVDGLGFAAPLGVHRPAGEFLLQAALVDAQQVGGEGQH